MRINVDSPVPLYHQIAEAIRYSVATGAIAAGAKLPPLREAASQWNVNLHTVRKAYDELARAGLVETRVPFGTRVRPLTETGHASADPNGIAVFIERVRREARERYAVSSRELVRRLLLSSGTTVREKRHRVSVVECSETQCSDLAQQLEARWDVQAIPWSLHRRGAPPRGPIVATYFHYNQVRQRWPDRIEGIRFAIIRPDSKLVDQLSLDRAGKGRQRLILCESEGPMANNIAADLRTILPKSQFEISIRILKTPPATLRNSRQNEFLLFSPRMWGSLPDQVRSRPRVYEARYVYAPEDLADIGRELGWLSHSQVGLRSASDG